MKNHGWLALATLKPSLLKASPPGLIRAYNCQTSAEVKVGLFDFRFSH
jgi:hypothetical protein